MTVRNNIFLNQESYQGKGAIDGEGQQVLRDWQKESDPRLFQKAFSLCQERAIIDPKNAIELLLSLHREAFNQKLLQEAEQCLVIAYELGQKSGKFFDSCQIDSLFLSTIDAYLESFQEKEADTLIEKMKDCICMPQAFLKLARYREERALHGGRLLNQLKQEKDPEKIKKFLYLAHFLCKEMEKQSPILAMTWFFSFATQSFEKQCLEEGRRFFLTAFELAKIHCPKADLNFCFLKAMQPLFKQGIELEVHNLLKKTEESGRNRELCLGYRKQVLLEGLKNKKISYYLELFFHDLKKKEQTDILEHLCLAIRNRPREFPFEPLLNAFFEKKENECVSIILKELLKDDLFIFHRRVFVSLILLKKDSSKLDPYCEILPLLPPSKHSAFEAMVKEMEAGFTSCQRIYALAKGLSFFTDLLVSELDVKKVFLSSHNSVVVWNPRGQVPLEGEQLILFPSEPTDGGKNQEEIFYLCNLVTHLLKPISSPNFSARNCKWEKNFAKARENFEELRDKLIEVSHYSKCSRKWLDAIKKEKAGNCHELTLLAIGILSALSPTLILAEEMHLKGDHAWVSIETLDGKQSWKFDPWSRFFGQTLPLDYLGTVLISQKDKGWAGFPVLREGSEKTARLSKEERPWEAGALDSLKRNPEMFL